MKKTLLVLLFISVAIIFMNIVFATSEASASNIPSDPYSRDEECMIIWVWY